MDQLNIAIVVLNYNGLGETLECLDSLRKLKTDQHKVQVIVVDNASSDGSAEALDKLKDIDLLKSPQNLGYSGGNNLGIKEGLRRGADFILILNNDTIVDVNLLTNLLADSQKADILSPKIYFAPGYEFHKDRYKKVDLGKVIWYAGARIDWQNIIGVHLGVDEVDSGQFNKRQEIDFATGACMFVKRLVFEKIGLFDEKYFLYLEDMDFCVRAREAGFKIQFCPQAIVWHKNAGSVGGSGSSLQDYYITRNRLLFAAKYAKLRTKLALLKQVLGQSKNPVKRRALFDFLTLRFGKGAES